MRIAVLDDYQGVARRSADWERADGHRRGRRVRRPRSPTRTRWSPGCAPFDVVVLMRERTPFPRRLIERLPALRLMVTTGRANALDRPRGGPERGHHGLRHAEPGQRHRPS